MQEIDIRGIFMIIRKKIWILLILITFLETITGYISCYVLEHEYKASIILMVGEKLDDGRTIEYSDILLNQNLVGTYGEIIKSRRIVSKVIENLDLNMKYEELTKKVNVLCKKDTQLVILEVKYNNPQLAAEIANEIASVFMNDIKELVKTDNVQLIDKATLGDDGLTGTSALSIN
jgi:capsular polysaccharide biosynthesis protein